MIITCHSRFPIHPHTTHPAGSTMDMIELVEESPKKGRGRRGEARRRRRRRRIADNSLQTAFCLQAELSARARERERERESRKSVENIWLSSSSFFFFILAITVSVYIVIQLLFHASSLHMTRRVQEPPNVSLNAHPGLTKLRIHPLHRPTWIT